MSRKRLIASLVAVLGIATGGLGAAPDDGPLLLNGVAAIVNDSVISVEEVRAFTRRQLEALGNNFADAAEMERRAQAIQKDSLELLIDRRLIIGDFKAIGGILPESILDEIVNFRIRKDYVDRVSLTKELHEKGRTWANFRKEEGEMMVVEEMVRKYIAQETMVSPRKLERYYAANRDKYKLDDRVHFRVIQIDYLKHARGEPPKIAAEALAKIRGGADFAAVANEYSDDARNYKGGDRGWLVKGSKELRPELRDAVFALAEGAVSDVLVVDGTAYILKVEKKEAAHVRTLSEMRIEIEGILRQQERERLRKAWIGRLRKKAYIRYY